jgi:hypothetical protein
VSRNSLLLTKENLQTRIKPLSNDPVRRIRRQNTHTVGGAGLEPAARKHVVPTYLPLAPSPPCVPMVEYVNKGEVILEITPHHNKNT